jgi:integrase
MSVIVKGKNANKPYTVRYWVDGKQREKSFATKREADDFKIKTDHDVRAQIFVDDKLGRQNFGEAASAWLAGLARSEQTKLVYGSVLNVYVMPALGSKTVTQVANDREAVSQLLTGSMAHLSHTRRSKALYIVTSVLDEAVKSGKIPNHRIAGIELADNGTTNDHSDFVFPTHSQLGQLADGLNGMGLTVWLMRGCGLRIAEVMAVKKSDFRDGGRTLRVSEQVLRSGKVSPLKARKANEFRDIPVPSYLWAMVKDLPDGYMFMRNGKFRTYSSYLESFKRYAGKAGIPDGFTPHSLRHAFVSALLTRGVAITDVARWVGHRDISITFATYGHLIPSAAAKAVSVLDAEYEDWASEGTESHCEP